MPTAAAQPIADATVLARPLALAQRGQFAEAETLLRRFLARRPNDPAAMYLLGWVLSRQRNFIQAVHFLRPAAMQDPPQHDAVIEYAVALFESREPLEAVRTAARATALFPKSIRAHALLARLLCLAGAFVDAMEACIRGLELDPEHGELMALFAWAMAGLGRAELAAEWYRKAAAATPGDLELRRRRAFHMCYSDASDPATLFAAHRAYAELAEQMPATWRVACSRTPTEAAATAAAGGILRVGVLSADLRDHPVSRFLEPLIDQARAHGIELLAYSTFPDPDEQTAALRPRFAGWRDLGRVADQAAAATIANDRLDALIDITGLTGDSRVYLMAARLAPFQFTYLGYPSTTGLRSMDFRIVDAVTDPAGASSEAFHTERLIRTPGCFLCFRPPADAPAVTVRDNAGSGIVFGSFNNVTKITEPTVRLWKAVLDATPGSRLLIKGRGFDLPRCADAFRRRFTEAGLDASRIELRAFAASHHEHLAAYADVDVSLDTVPYNGTTTTCEALWMGVPVVTVRGRSHVSRVGASLLQHAGLSQLVANNANEFVRIASRIAADRPGLIAMRTTLREQILRSGLCNERNASAGFWGLVRQTIANATPTSTASRA